MVLLKKVYIPKKVNLNTANWSGRMRCSADGTMQASELAQDLG